MQHQPRHRHLTGAFTLLEAVLVVAIITLIAALLLPAIETSRQRARQSACANNLRQIGLALHGFAHDHNSLFPMQASTNVGGTMEFIKAGHSLTGQFFFAYRHFQALSNDLGEPKLLICPTDKRTAATNFAALRNENVSYFVNTAAEYGRPNSLVAGDRNIESVQGEAGSVLRPGESFIRWTEEQHILRGNVLFADARVEGLTGGALNDQLRARAGDNTGGANVWLPTESSAWSPSAPGQRVPGTATMSLKRESRTIEKTFEQLARIQNAPGSGGAGNAAPASRADSEMPASTNEMERANAVPAADGELPPGVAQDDIAVMRAELGQTNLTQVLALVKQKGRTGLLTAVLWFLLVLALTTLIEIWRRRRRAQKLRAQGTGG